MSADLVGSTAYKASNEHDKPRDGKLSPPWVDDFRQFYKDFPIKVEEAYKQLIPSSDPCNEPLKDSYPRVWKTIGDEIVFCSRAYSISHAALSVSAFIKALERYSDVLEKANKPLRLKGAGWLAAFPAPNISIVVVLSDKYNTLSENTEEFEGFVDKNPNQCDFLGKGIDTGFRIAKNASEDRFVTSVQLGYVLAKATTEKKFPHSFGYHGREVLKGVINGAPYPVVSVETERSAIKMKLKSRESALTSELNNVSPHALCDFLETFMSVANIEFPCLAGDGPWQEKFPRSYENYQEAFDKELNIDNNNINQLKKGSEDGDESKNALEEQRTFLGTFSSADDGEGHESPKA